jgi:hypothetical protein
MTNDQLAAARLIDTSGKWTSSAKFNLLCALCVHNGSLRRDAKSHIESKNATSSANGNLDLAR